MKIKKKTAGEGGAAIADRFKLEPAANAKGGAAKGTIGKTSSLVALIFGFIGLLLAGSLAFMLFVHWDFLIPA